MSKEREELLEALDDLGGVCYEYSSLEPILIYVKKQLAKLPLEPLSGETIAELWGEPYSGKTLRVCDFARSIEKAHGITGVDDE